MHVPILSSPVTRAGSLAIPAHLMRFEGVSGNPYGRRAVVFGKPVLARLLVKSLYSGAALATVIGEVLSHPLTGEPLDS
jgi:hypothetical protein